MGGNTCPHKAGTLAGPAFGIREMMRISNFAVIHGNPFFAFGRRERR
jgi:hypothetical protein